MLELNCEAVRIDTPDIKEEKRLSPALGYEPKEPLKRRSYKRPLLELLLLIVVFVGLGLLIGWASIPFPLLITVPLAVVLWHLLRSRKKVTRSTTDEEYEAKWQATLQQNQEKLAVARHIYAQGPFGEWRFTEFSFPAHGPSKVVAERVIILDPNGTSRCRLTRHNPLITFESTFRFKFEGEDIFLVQMISPPLETWHKVTFGFEVRRGLADHMELVLWFESDNPLIADQSEYWPFHGEFSREN